MKIYRPLWREVIGKGGDPRQHQLDTWFDENVEPINKILAEAVEVTGLNKGDGWGWFSGDSTRDSDTHKALLICIEEIEKKCPTCGK